jgi:hypothetical protein
MPRTRTRTRIQPRRYDPLPADTIHACYTAHHADILNGCTGHGCTTCTRYTRALTLALHREQAAP